jgi:hypothetical protein
MPTENASDFSSAAYPKDVIDFALNLLAPWEIAEFLSDYRKGDLKSYPDFVDYAARSSRFGDTKLITPERLAADPQATLATHPAWVRHIEFVTPEPQPEAYPAVQPVVMVWAGERRIQYEAHTTIATAIMFEVTRLPGLSIAVNNNGGRSNYFRFTVADAGEDLTTVSRFLMNAGPDERVMKTPSRETDMRPETLAKRKGGKGSKDGRLTLMAHIERLANAWEASGQMSPGFTAVAYLDNLQRLLRVLDLEATGRELSDMLPIVRSDS